MQHTFGGEVIGVAAHHYVGVERGVGQCHFELHVGDVGQAGCAAQALAQGTGDVQRNDDVVLARASLSEDLAADLFMLDGLFGLPGEVVLAVEARGGVGQGHGGFAWSA